MENLPVQNNSVKTFLGEQIRTMRSIELDFNVCCRQIPKVPVLIDPDLDVSFEVKGLMGAIHNISQNGHRVADRFYVGRNSNSVHNIDGLLGIDVLYLFEHFSTIPCIKGRAIKTCHGIIPFGPVRSFLIPSQQSIIFNNESDTNAI